MNESQTKRTGRLDPEIMKKLTKDAGDSSVTVEFECDGCCKKALNGTIWKWCGDFLILVAKKGCILVKTISCGKIAEKQTVKAIVIPFSRVCSIEIGAVQIDP